MTDANLHPPDSPEPIPEEKAPDAEVTATEAITPTPDPLAQIQADLEAAKAEAEQWRDRFLRKAAEFDNYRKRMDKERTEAVALARSSVLLEFLPIADACERALESFNKDAADSKPGLERYREGVELLYRQMQDKLVRMGVTPIEAVGQKFDPHLHDALVREESSEHDENTVIQELQRGYMFKDRLLRPSQVIVSTRPKDQK